MTDSIFEIIYMESRSIGAQGHNRVNGACYEFESDSRK